VSIPFTRQTDSAEAIVAIKAIDLEKRLCTGWNQQVGDIQITFALMAGGVFSIPVLGEQWVVKRSSRDSWVLVSKTPHMDDRFGLDPVQGLTALGSSGPTYLVGSPVVLPQITNLGTGQIRLLGGVLQTRPDDQSAWVTVTGGGAGITQGTAPHKVSYIQTLATRAVGYGQVLDGIRPGPCTFTRAIYTFGTQDVSGSSTVEMRGNSGATLAGSSLAVSAANQAQGDATKAARTVTGSWVFAEDDILSVYTSAVPASPGDRLTVHLTGTVNLTLS